ncbi:hypothetical protein [Campylobacter ureolyticus]|uniref:hypothetical protein n=1 Tax=Campylobacter ureolyticus TaxID=827 RepID=UPI001FC82FDA|nr:hypothetical protein [Campylobacter ureolyticus]MCZ6105760.1 hypothetical protein [Campylobacter ureolyticus]MCZ6158005.1 hypothetical protein [Campylobacter ureolyticus]GKH60848.1 hypothetical protein CE91St25_11840 [Campylobacter ureolyticus]
MQNLKVKFGLGKIRATRLKSINLAKIKDRIFKIVIGNLDNILNTNKHKINYDNKPLIIKTIL